MKKVKLIDVANKAGVSKSTASQYLNGRYEYMSEKTRERIRLAVEELNFTPNSIARSLKTQKTHTIGVIVNSIIGVITSYTIRGIDDYFKKNGYNVLIYNTDYSADAELKSLDTLKSLNADGLIITSSGHINDRLMAEDAGGLPVVHINRDFEGLNVNKVMSDYHQGSYDATRHLIDMGHRHIAVLTNPYENIPSRIRRLDGFRDAMSDHGLTVDDNQICVIDDTLDVAKAYNRLLSSDTPPTVIFSMFSQITVQLLSLLQERETNIPEEMSVICFDDFPLAHLFKTPVTAVDQSAYALGEATAKRLLEIINGDQTEKKMTLLPCNLVIRDSCSKLN